MLRQIQPTYLNTNLPFKLMGCKLPSGVAFVDVSDATELTDDNDERTSETGATPSDDNISSKSLKNLGKFYEREKEISFFFILDVVCELITHLLSRVLVLTASQLTSRILHIFDFLFAASPLFLLANRRQFGLLPFQLRLPIHGLLQL